LGSFITCTFPISGNARWSFILTFASVVCMFHCPGKFLAFWPSSPLVTMCTFRTCWCPGGWERTAFIFHALASVFFRASRPNILRFRLLALFAVSPRHVADTQGTRHRPLLISFCALALLTPCAFIQTPLFPCLNSYSLAFVFNVPWLFFSFSSSFVCLSFRRRVICHFSFRWLSILVIRALFLSFFLVTAHAQQLKQSFCIFSYFVFNFIAPHPLICFAMAGRFVRTPIRGKIVLLFSRASPSPNELSSLSFFPLLSFPFISFQLSCFFLQHHIPFHLVIDLGIRFPFRPFDVTLVHSLVVLSRTVHEPFIIFQFRASPSYLGGLCSVGFLSCLLLVVPASFLAWHLSPV